ncbi:Oligosaccharide translocation protein RFT1 [Abortiporus biennis]
MSSPPPSLLSASLASVSSLVLLQLFSRVFTFALNQALVRLVSPSVFGTAAIQFELLLSTILFLSREGVRNSLLRASPTQKPSTASETLLHDGKKPKSTKPSSEETQAKSDDITLIANISLLPVLLGIPVTILSAYFYLSSSSVDTRSQPHFQLSVVIYALAAFFELLSEPLYIRAQNDLRFDVRVKAEGIAVFLKTLVAFVTLVTMDPEWALVAFALGQAAYGVSTFLSFLRAYGGRVGYWPEQVKDKVHGNTKWQYFDTPLLHLSAAMTGQSVIKHFLTEGDKFLVSTLSPLTDQGGYAIASNYGSLIARIVFQPIEETSRVFFSKTLSLSTTVSDEALQAASSIFLTLLLLFTHLFLLLVTFAPPYLPLVISIMLPPRYHSTSAPSILKTYVYYIPMMAYNGVLEAFFSSIATPKDLRVQSRWMLLFSLTFVGTAVLLSKYLELGDAGLVWANVVNLLLRAVFSWSYSRTFFASKGKEDLVASRSLPLTLRGQFGHVGIGAGCVVVCLVTCVLLERNMFKQLYSTLRKR